MGKKAKKKARTPSKDKRMPTRIQKDAPHGTNDPNVDAVNDGVSVTTEKRRCPHLDKGLNLTALSEKLGSLGMIRCEDCREGGVDRRGNKSMGKHGKKKGSSATDLKSESRAIWICLECGHYGCGGVGFPTIPQSHAVRHARLTRHQLVIQLENPNLRWCFPCSGPVSVEKVEECGESKDFLGEVMKLIKGRSGKSSKSDAEDIWFGDGNVTGEVIQKADGIVSGTLEQERSVGFMVRGLVNLGNTCFFNSIMQNLLAMDRLRDYFLTSETSSVGPLTISLKKLFSEIKSDEGTRNVINPRLLFGSLCSKAPQFRGYQQHDSHELLRCLLDLLSTEESDMRKGEILHGNSKILTFVDSVFGGQISSTVCCTECGFSSTVYEPFLDLSLPVPTKKPIPKKSLPASRGKKAKLIHKRGSRSQAKKVSRNVTLSTSTDNLQPLSECLEVSVSSSVGDSQLQGSSVTNDEQDIKDVRNGGSALPVEGSAEKEAAVTEDHFSWLDYLDSSEPLSAESNLFSQENISSLSERDPLHSGSTWRDYLCPENVADDMVPTSVNINDVRSSDHCAVDDYLNEEQHSKSSWDDQEPLLRVQDSEVLLLPYREEDIEDSLVPSGDGQVDASLKSPSIGQEEAAEFDGFGDLFAEPEIATVDTGDSSLGIQTGLLSGNSSDSDPSQVDDSDSPVSVESCLAHFTKPELLSKDNAWHCEKCSKSLQLCQMNKTRKNKSSEKIPNSGTEDKNGTNRVIVTDLSSNEKSNSDLSCSGKLDHSGNNSMKCDDSKKRKGELEDDTTKPDLKVILNYQTCETLANGLDADLLDNEPELVEEGEESPETAAPMKVKRDATKRVLIFNSPPVLTVHLKRFCQDARGRLSKLSGHIVFQETMDLKPYIDSRGKSEGKCLYRLQGVVEHLGTMRGGHYVAYVRGHSSVWYHVSDAYVREVSLDEVLRCDAYILFYELV
ncbi:hypothetical protein SAY86_013065 [Trapa natans]|uniref:Ubiquitin carboxyl-terminal hydrolase n=1 Tax=Trapa natans TaxID=22666 RepID=A0AAN7LXR7_TRANT|nr:hypothetical protein SAY86_013065 [Trapa natans]